MEGNGNNKDVVASFYVEVFQKGNVDYIDEVCAPDTVWHDVPPGMPATNEGTKEFSRQFNKAFTEQEWTVEAIIEEDGLVCWCGTFKGHHTGEFMGMPATDKWVEVRDMDLVRIRDEKCVEHWGVLDFATMMMQMGVLPDPTA